MFLFVNLYYSCKFFQSMVAGIEKECHGWVSNLMSSQYIGETIEMGKLNSYVNSFFWKPPPNLCLYFKTSSYKSSTFKTTAHDFVIACYRYKVHPFLKRQLFIYLCLRSHIMISSVLGLAVFLLLKPAPWTQKRLLQLLPQHSYRCILIWTAPRPVICIASLSHLQLGLPAQASNRSRKKN